MSIRPDQVLGRLPPPARLDRGVPGVFHRENGRRRKGRRRIRLHLRERRLGRRLDRDLAGSSIVLHSRLGDDGLACPPIDHLVISAAGVWVITADYRVSRLRHGSAVAAVAERHGVMNEQAAVCRSVVASIGFDWLDVRPVLCTANARGMLRRPISVDGVSVARPGALASMVSRAGPLAHADVVTVAAELARRLPAAR